MRLHSALSGRTVTLDRILVGEVWDGSGQSNMEWPMGRHQMKDSAAEVAAADHPNLRLLLVPKVSAPAPAATCRRLEGLHAGDRGFFSAVAYFFGRALQSELNVPIGLIADSWGGTEIEAWISREGLASEPSLAAHLDPAAAAACEADKKARRANEPAHRAGIPLQRHDRPARPLRHPRRHLVSGREQRKPADDYRKLSRAQPVA